MKDFYIMFQKDGNSFSTAVEGYEIPPGEERPFDVPVPEGWSFRCWVDQTYTVDDRQYMNSINYTLPS